MDITGQMTSAQLILLWSLLFLLLLWMLTFLVLAIRPGIRRANTKEALIIPLHNSEEDKSTWAAPASTQPSGTSFPFSPDDIEITSTI